MLSPGNVEVNQAKARKEESFNVVCSISFLSDLVTCTKERNGLPRVLFYFKARKLKFVLFGIVRKLLWDKLCGLLQLTESLRK